MRFLSNTYNPEAPNAYFLGACRCFNQTQEEAYQQWMRWLKDKIIADPKATETYTVEQLKHMNMVGVYEP
jgi:hypothetical protein